MKKTIPAVIMVMVAMMVALMIAGCSSGDSDGDFWPTPTATPTITVTPDPTPDTDPVVESVNPSNAGVGDVVTITGKNFGASRNPSTVTVGGNDPGEYLQWGDTQIQVQLGPKSNTGPVVVTVDGVSSNDDVLLTRDRSWDDAQYLAGSSTYDASHAELAGDPDSNVIVVFKWDNEDGGTAIYATRFDSSTGLWSTPVDISTGPDTPATGSNCRPRISMDDAGNAVVAFVNRDGGGASVYANRYNASTNQWLAEPELLAEFMDNENWPCHAEVGVDPAGNAIVAYKNYYWDEGISWWSNDSNILARRFDAVTGEWEDAVIISTPEDEDTGDYYGACRPRVGMDENGNAVVSFVQNYNTSSGGSGTETYVNHYDASTGQWTGVVRVSPEVDIDADRYCHNESAVSRNGDAVVTFLRNGQNDGQVMAATYDASTGTWSNAVIISNYEACNNKVAMNDHGGAVVVYVNDNTLVMGVIYDNTTGSWSAPAQASGLSNNQSCHPTVAMDNNGNAVLGYKHYGNDGNEIWATKYDALEKSWGGATLLSGTDYNACRPRVAMDPWGNSALVYVLNQEEVHATLNW